MPQVKVSQEISGKKQDVFKAVKAYLEEKAPLQKIGAEIEWDDKKCCGLIEASNFKGELAIDEKSGKTIVAISIDLPLLLTPFKGKVEEELKKHLGRVKV